MSDSTGAKEWFIVNELREMHGFARCKAEAKAALDFLTHDNKLRLYSPKDRLQPRATYEINPDETTVKCTFDDGTVVDELLSDAVWHIAFFLTADGMYDYTYPVIGNS